jgi:16S rRNA (guanine527-N7)-methyltransferase
VQRQYAESLELLRITIGQADPPSTVTDVGSGGGWPGIVFAAVFPDMRLELVEPLRKRARLLEELTAELGLRNIAVHALRAEEAGRSPLRDGAAAVTARAVANLATLLEYTAPLAAPGARIVLPKGSRLDEELAESATAQRLLAVSFNGVEPMRPEVSETLRVMVFTKLGATGARYPRRAGTPGKQPLRGPTS